MRELHKRVAAAILVPRLIRQVAETRRGVATYRGFLERLNAARQQALITEKVHATLAAEYQLGLESPTSRLRTLEAEVDVWQTKGRTILEEGLAWIKEQEEVVKARESVGQLTSEEAQERIDALIREMAQVREQIMRLIAL